MKAKTIDIPTPRLLVLLVLIFISICFGITTLQAEEIKILPKTEVSNLFEGSMIELDRRTNAEKLHDFGVEGQKIAEARAIRIAEEKARYEAELARIAEEKARIEAEIAAKAEAARIAEEARIAAIQAEEVRFSIAGVCAPSSYKKSYMDYRSIAPNSAQMRIINAQSVVREDGLLVTEDGFIGVALGSHYGSLGSKFRFTTDTGQEFKVIKVDEKADIHTINGCQDASGTMVEFVIDTKKASSAYPKAAFSGSFHVIPQFSGNIIQVEKYN